MADADIVLNALMNAKSYVTQDVGAQEMLDEAIKAARRLSPSPVGDVPARIGGRLRLCEEETVERPYRAPVATVWYAEDVAALLAVIREKDEALTTAEAKLEQAREALRIIARWDDMSDLVAELREALDDPERYKWAAYPWEHLGDAERDVRALLNDIERLRERVALLEQVAEAARGSARYARCVDLDAAVTQGGYPDLKAALAALDAARSEEGK